MKNNLLLIISKIHTKKFYITKKLFIRCCSIFFMKMFPCPDTGMFFCFMNRSVCIFCCIHKSNISFINFRFFIKKCKNSLCSGKRHCYDIAKQGHVNFAPNAKPSFYKKELFESRAKAFEAGVFAPVVAAVGEALEKYVRAERPVVADAGCGEGYYLRSVCPERDMIRIGFDLSKEAVLLAAKGDRRSTYFVGDLANIPLADGCCDAVLDVFTPANYAQFGRILKKDGVLIKLAPRPGYLRQLREAAGGRLAAYDGAPVSDYAHAHLNVLEQRTITYTMPVSGALALHLAKMTPMLANIDAESLDLSGVTEITVDETMIVGTIKREEES